MSDRCAPVGADGLFVARVRMPAEGRVDRAFRLAGRAPDESKIAAPERTFALFGDLPGQRGVCLVGLRHNHEAGRVLVEAMNNSRPLAPADTRQAIAAMSNQRIDQSAARVTGCG